MVMPSARPGADEAMHGREPERRVVRDLLRRAQRGTGGVVLVEGEPGIGKSLLLCDGVDQAAAHGFSLAAGAADQLGRAIPFFALRAALGEAFATLTSDRLDHDLPVAPEWWIGQMRAHLEHRAAATPLLVGLDDVQWACPATLAALRTLPRALKRYPVAWVLARSSTPQQDTEYLFGLLEKDGAARISLAPLGADAVAALLTAAFGAPPDPGLLALAAGASGNPSLLAELIGGLRDDDAVQLSDGQAVLVSSRMPRRMHRVAHQRLDGLSKRARNLLVTAAVTHAFDAGRNTFTQAYGSAALDASLPLIPRLGFLPATDPRVLGTIAAVRRELSEGGLVRRYQTGETDDGIKGTEGLFIACSFWLVDALYATGEHRDAVDLFERLLLLRNDVGLLSEEWDPAARRQLGNTPQAFSHFALVISALQLHMGETVRSDNPMRP
jgi:hypothetical protein